jgi:hypothetical protein
MICAVMWSECVRKDGRKLANRYERAVLTKHEAAWDQIPSALKYDESTGSENVSPTKRYVLMALHMEQNHNRFLLRRKFLKDNQSSRESLLKIARSQLSTVLQIIAISDQISGMHRDISSFVSIILSRKRLFRMLNLQRYYTMDCMAPVS